MICSDSSNHKSQSKISLVNMMHYDNTNIMMMYSHNLCICQSNLSSSKGQVWRRLVLLLLHFLDDSHKMPKR